MPLLLFLYYFRASASELFFNRHVSLEISFAYMQLILTLVRIV